MQRRDVAACQAILARGSRSFALAGRVLPRRLRGEAAVVYAFCREADDAIDQGTQLAAELAGLHRRLDGVYAPDALPAAATAPLVSPVDRALQSVVRRRRIPRALFEALLEGFAWDAANRRYESLEALYDYAARVAGSVGVIMALLMGQDDPRVLACASDLGVAMQLTNIARDVGEDARAGRLYVPTPWLREVGIEPEAWVAAPHASLGLALLVARLLDHAEPLYARAVAGIRCLPADCRVAVRAAALIYADIGTALRALGCDSVHNRAVVGGGRKLWLIGRALAALFWRPTPVPPALLPQTAFLVDAAARRRAA